jgi:DNA repair protein RadC
MSTEKEFIPITAWAEGDRPREKLLEKGVPALSDAELIAILLGSGSRNESAVELAKRILAGSDNSFHKLARLSPSELTKFQGVGTAKAVTLVAAMEIARRRSERQADPAPKITSSIDAYNLMAPLLMDLNHEEFWVIYLHQSNKIIARKKISQGGIAGTVTDVRVILKEALLVSAPAMILVHNHPSGNLNPSPQDLSITKKIKEAATIIDMRVLDHIIIGGVKYYSFADEGSL